VFSREPRGEREPVRSRSEADMETIILNYDNLRYNLNTTVDWSPLRLIRTAVRSVTQDGRRHRVKSPRKRQTWTQKKGERERERERERDGNRKEEE